MIEPYYTTDLGKLYQGHILDILKAMPPESVHCCVTSQHGVCSECGGPWIRVVEKTGHINKREPAHCPNNCDTKVDSTGWAPTTRATNEWQPTCKCNADRIPGTVLDPFAGAGTTALVCEKLNRKWIGIELSEEYCGINKSRIEQATKQLKLFGQHG